MRSLTYDEELEQGSRKSWGWERLKEGVGIFLKTILAMLVRNRVKGLDE